MISPKDYIKLYRKENPPKINKPNQNAIFEDDKPLVLPEFNLKDGMIRDLLESKSK